MATKINPRSCLNCRNLGSECDGGEPEYSVSWPSCNKVERYQYLKSFPFKKRMSCFRYELQIDMWKCFETEQYCGGVWTDRDAERLKALESVGQLYR
jgi:hypothetical protein